MDKLTNSELQDILNIKEQQLKLLEKDISSIREKIIQNFNCDSPENFILSLDVKDCRLTFRYPYCYVRIQFSFKNNMEKKLFDKLFENNIEIELNNFDIRNTDSDEIRVIATKSNILDIIKTFNLNISQLLANIVKNDIYFFKECIEIYEKLPIEFL